MATQIDKKDLDIQEQLASIRRTQAEIDQRFAETSRAKAETDKHTIDTERIRTEIEQRLAEIAKINEQTKVIRASTIFQGGLAFAAILGAGAAIAKIFFP